MTRRARKENRAEIHHEKGDGRPLRELRDLVASGVEQGHELYLELMEMLRFHPKFPEKAGAGVARIVVRENEHGNAREFWFVRRDGTEEHISFKQAASGWYEQSKGDKRKA